MQLGDDIEGLRTKAAELRRASILIETDIDRAVHALASRWANKALVIAFLHDALRQQLACAYELGQIETHIAHYWERDRQIDRCGAMSDQAFVTEADYLDWQR